MIVIVDKRSAVEIMKGGQRVGEVLRKTPRMHSSQYAFLLLLQHPFHGVQKRRSETAFILPTQLAQQQKQGEQKTRTRDTMCA